jgi:alkanesulfonate monooxygenase SsuD/methylene tetrahydromethanopterin reductase-like flavin-dependent oxidoreductase (luciferase family)
VAPFRLELPTPISVPIWVAALGDRMVRLAGECADGVLLNWCSPERVRAARSLVDEAAARAGRDRAAVTVAVYVRACLGLEEPVAMEALKEMTGRYAAIPHYHRQFEAMGLGQEAALAAKAFESGMPGEVPDQLVRAVAVTGGRREALLRFAEYREAGADLVFCYPVTSLDPFSSLLGTVLGAAPSPSSGS